MEKPLLTVCYFLFRWLEIALLSSCLQDENPQKANQRFNYKYGYVRSTVSDFPASREIDYLV